MNSTSENRIIPDAARKALAEGVAFAMYRLPGEGLRFMADPHLTGHSPIPAAINPELSHFEIGRWLAPYAQKISILPCMAAEEFLHTKFYPKPLTGFLPQPAMTKEEYLKTAEQVAADCRTTGGKTVLSRVISGRNQKLDIGATAIRLFDSFDGAFGFLYYTPLTGIWMGASPETLLSVDLRTRKITTMAFAGTRPSAADAPWDEKNLRENRFVVDHIVGRMNELGVSCEVSALYTSGYGAIQHLRCDICATLPSGMDFSKILDRINPTSALCGTPLLHAMEIIARTEPHSRSCYGGFVGVNTPGRSFRSFVNLRSCALSPSGDYNLYVGGGIIGCSDPATEYSETEAKASRLLSLLH